MSRVDKRPAISLGQFNKAIKTPEENIKYAISETTPLVWYALLHGIDDDFKHGEYLVRAELTAKFPYDPPWFYLMTPNGVYDIEKKVCIDIGGYHSQNFRAALGVGGFLKQLVSGLIGGIDHGISILHTSSAEKKQLALQSREYNLQHNKAILEHVEAVYAEYSAKWTPSNDANSMQ